MAFIKAKPIWLEQLEHEMNLQAGFKTTVRAEPEKTYRMVIAAAYVYRLYINGSFVCYGPARAAHGYARVDRVDITPHLVPGKNTIALETVGYNVCNYYLIKQPSFLCAEILEDDRVICATGYDFTGFRLTERVQKCLRYSYQRPFPDVWELDRGSIRYHWTTAEIPSEPVAVVNSDVQFLERRSQMPEFHVVRCDNCIETGVTQPVAELPAFLFRQRTYTDPSETFDCFPLSELQRTIVTDYYSTCKIPQNTCCRTAPITLRAGEYALLDMGRNYTGFVKTRIRAASDSDVLIAMDEKLADGIPNPMAKKNTNAIIGYYLKGHAQAYDLESFECHGFRYALVEVQRGEIVLEDFSLREYAAPLHNLPPVSIEDETLRKIYTAAIETYRQNAVDLYMDCPTRERAGWLCDSYYTAQSEYHFTGGCNVEQDFVENFLLYTPRDGLVDNLDGFLPMCYPADFLDHNTIPQWSIWFVLELVQYLQRNPETTKETYRNLIYRLIGAFSRYENADGLVEKLPRWNFIEWSAANSWVQDINYPSNMMYARLLEIAGQLYDDQAMLKKCAALRKTILEKSFDGKLFIDNAVYNEDGIAVNTGNHSEVCQYYACFFGLIDNIDDPRFAYLKDLIFNVFGPLRQEQGILPEIEPANALMGVYIRMELLYHWGRYEQLLEEIKLYFGKMADLTGTLWENNTACASLNHGFASFAGVMIAKCLEKIKHGTKTE